MVLGNWRGTDRKIKLDHLLIPHTRIKSKWIKDLNVTLKTTKILEENIGSKILDISYSHFFFSDVSPQARETKGKKNQVGLHQTKQLLRSKGIHQQNKKTTHRMGEHIW